jgi:hypothetical protein
MLIGQSVEFRPDWPANADTVAWMLAAVLMTRQLAMFYWDHWQMW